MSSSSSTISVRVMVADSLNLFVSVSFGREPPSAMARIRELFLVRVLLV
jgi:hypothetical protein